MKRLLVPGLTTAYFYLARPIIFLFDSEKMHIFVLGAGGFFGKIPIIPKLLKILTGRLRRPVFGGHCRLMMREAPRCSRRAFVLRSALSSPRLFRRFQGSSTERDPQITRPTQFTTGTARTVAAPITK